MKHTRILRTKITRITSVMLFLVCLLFGLSVTAQNDMELIKSIKSNANIGLKEFIEKKSPAVNKNKSNTDWWGPDTVYIYKNPNQTYKEFRSYNQYGYSLTELCQELKNNEWINVNQYTNAYDVNNNLLSRLYQEWRNGAWVNFYNIVRIYDANSNLLTELFQYWRDSAWVDTDKSTYTYDANNNRQSAMWQIRRNNAWVNNEKVTATYDANNILLNILYQKWENNAWENIEKNVFTYDANNNMLMLLFQGWQNNAWIDTDKITYIYDVNDNMLAKLYQSWRDNAWVNGKIITYTYDANNNRITGLVQRWADTWENYSKDTYTYDANNNCTLAERSEWINENWQQSVGYMNLFYNNMKSEIEYFCYKVTASYKYFKRPENFGKELQNDLPNISIYPNPTNNSFVVDMEGETTVKLHNMLGKEVLSEKANGKSVINISHLPNGVYNVQVFAGNKIIGYSKIVKQ